MTLFFTVFIYLLGFGIIIPILPAISKEFGASSTEIGLLMSSFSFFQFVFAPLWGKLSDRYGRRPILIFCMAGEAVSYVLFAFSGSLAMLFFARSLSGAFGGAISTASAYVSDVTERKERSKGMGMIGAAFGLGFLVGPVMGGGLTFVGKKLGSAPPFGLSFPSLFVALLCLVSLLFVYLKLKEPERRKTAETKSSRWRLFQLLSKDKRALVLMGVYFLTNMGFSMMEPVLFLKTYDDLGWSPVEASLGFAYIGLIMVFTQGYLVRKLLPRFGEPRLLLVGCLAMGLALIGIGLSFHVVALALVLTVMALGSGVYNPSVLGSMSLLSPDEIQGEVFGVTQSLSALARICGPPLGGYLYGSLFPGSSFFVAGLLVLGGFLLILTIFQRLPSGATAVH